MDGKLTWNATEFAIYIVHSLSYLELSAADEPSTKRLLENLLPDLQVAS